MEESVSPTRCGLSKAPRSHPLRAQRWCPRGGHAGSSATATLDPGRKVQEFGQSPSADKTMSPQQPRGDVQRKASLIGELIR